MSSRHSWVPHADATGFSLAHLPLGVRRRPDGSHAVVARIGDYVADLRVLAEIGLFDDCGCERGDFASAGLNRLIGRGRGVCAAVRRRVQACLDEAPGYFDFRERREIFLLSLKRADLVLPVQVGDYTDFYSSLEHATNVGKLFRDPDQALLPNWRHLPVAYHGRASSVVASGTPVRRPVGQTGPSDAGGGGFGESRTSGDEGRTGGDEGAVIRFGESRQLDFELEVACVIGAGTTLGAPVDIARAEEHVFGLSLFNDWSARDIQRWEYQPLGPFLGKSFASSMSHWVTPLEALEPFRVNGPAQEPTPLPYLRTTGARHFDIDLEVWLTPYRGQPQRLSRTNARHLYWSIAQQLAHHTSNGCNLRPGDVCASGTISGPTPGSAGSLLELTRGGREALRLRDGGEVTFLADGDEVTLRASATRGDATLTFGEVSGQILASAK